MWYQIVAASAAVRNWWIALGSSRHRKNIKKSRQLLERLGAIEHLGARINYLRKIDPYVFEELVLSIFEHHGYIIWRSGSYSGDGGFDGKVYVKGKGWHLIQSKRYGAHIKAAHLKQFATLVEQKAKGGFFVHSGKTSEDLRAWVRDQRIRVLSGSLLVESITNGDRLKQLMSER